jgi:glycine/D-amino acid oxidase-like deaminating enzyme
VAVIGGGIMGVSTAYWLARFGADVLLVESRDLAFGASGRNGGLVLGDDVSLNEIQAVLREEGIDADYEEPGHLSLASSSAVLDQMQQEVAKRSPTATPVHVVGRNECEEMLGMRINKRFQGGRWMPRSATIHPVRFVRGLAAAAVRHGAQLSRGNVLRVEQEGNFVHVETSKQRIRARQVVLACNYATTRFLPALRKVLSPVRGQVLSSQPLGPMFRIGLAVDWGTNYWRQCKDGVVVLGGYRNLDVAAETTPRQRLNPLIQRALTHFLPDAFPDFPKVVIAGRWAGIMDQTPDGKPLVGKWSNTSNIWINAGFGGHGLPPALRLARELAQSILQGSCSIMLKPYDPVRFAKVLCS